MRAALDVFEKEPEVHPGLLKNPNVVSRNRNAGILLTADFVSSCGACTRLHGEGNEL